MSVGLRAVVADLVSRVVELGFPPADSLEYPLAIDAELDKIRAAGQFPFVHDMAQTVLPLIAAYRQARSALSAADALSKAMKAWVLSGLRLDNWALVQEFGVAYERARARSHGEYVPPPAPSESVVP